MIFSAVDTTVREVRVNNARQLQVLTTHDGVTDMQCINLADPTVVKALASAGFQPILCKVDLVDEVEKLYGIVHCMATGPKLAVARSPGAQLQQMQHILGGKRFG